MKQYIVGSNTPAGIDENLRLKIQSVVETGGGEVLNVGEGGFMMLVKASEETIKKVKAIQGVTSVNENHRRVIPHPGVMPPRKNNGPKLG